MAACQSSLGCLVASMESLVTKLSKAYIQQDWQKSDALVTLCFVYTV